MSKKLLSKAVVGCGILLFLALSLIGRDTILRQIEILRMRNFLHVGDEAVKKRDFRRAAFFYNRAVATWREYGNLPTLNYAEKSQDYFLAGNAFRKIGHLRAALDFYEQGLKYDPFSISLLTSAGLCAYAMGELEIARNYLERSRKIYPLKKNISDLLRQISSAAGTKVD